MGQTPFYLTYLVSELQRRKSQNPLYSLRAFAQSLDFDSSQLSRVMNRKETPSLESAQSLCQKLSLDDQKRAQFIQSAASERACVSLKNIDPTLTNCNQGE